MTCLRLTLIGIAVLLLVGGASADDTKPPAAALRDKSLEVRRGAYDQILKERTQTISDLIAIVKDVNVDQSQNGPRYQAIELLGKLRAAEAVETLAAHLLFLPVFPDGVISIWEMLPTEAYYPSAFALVRIGEPSIQRMLQTIMQTKKEEERHVAAWVIMEIEGKEQASHRLETMISSNKAYQDQLRSAKNTIDNYSPTFNYPTEPPWPQKPSKD